MKNNQHSISSDKIIVFYFIFLIEFNFLNFTILYWFAKYLNESATGIVF